MPWLWHQRACLKQMLVVEQPQPIYGKNFYIWEAGLCHCLTIVTNIVTNILTKYYLSLLIKIKYTVDCLCKCNTATYFNFFYQWIAVSYLSLKLFQNNMPWIIRIRYWCKHIDYILNEKKNNSNKTRYRMNKKKNLKTVSDSHSIVLFCFVFYIISHGCYNCLITRKSDWLLNIYDKLGKFLVSANNKLLYL